MDDQHNTTPSAGTPNPTPNAMNTPEEKGAHDTPPAGGSSRSSGGPIVAIIIIIALLILGGLYFWGAQLNQGTPNDQLPLIPGDAMMEGEDGANSGSDSLGEISAELDGEGLDDFDAELEAALDNMEAELEASAQ